MDKYKIPLGCTSVSVPYSQKYNVYMVVTVKKVLELRKRQLPHGDHHIGNGWQEHAANVIYFQNINDWESHKNLGGITGGINDCFFYFRSKGEGGVSANPKNPYQKILRFFFTKEGGGLTQSKIVLSDFLAQFAKNGGFI